MWIKDKKIKCLIEIYNVELKGIKYKGLIFTKLENWQIDFVLRKL